jgi:hypothetical protein
MALIKGKLIDPNTAIKQLQDPVVSEDLARKGYVDTKAAAEADAAELAAKAYADQKVAALVNGAPAMLDTLKELADAIESGSSDLSQEILTQVGLVDDKIDQEILDRQAAVSDEQSRAEGEEARIEGKVDQEVLDRQAAVSAEQLARESSDSALSGRIETLETAPKPEGRKESKVMSFQDISNAYVDLAVEVMSGTLMVSVSGTVQYEGEDYSLSVVAGKTRVTFIGDLTPDGNGAALVVEDKVYFQYMVMA